MITPETNRAAVALVTAAIDGGDDALLAVIDGLTPTAELVLAVAVIAAALADAGARAGVPVATILTGWAALNQESA